MGFNSEDSIKSLIGVKELRPILTFSEKSEYQGVSNVKEVGFPELIEPIKSQRYVIAPPGLPANIKKILVDSFKNVMLDKEFLAWNAKADLSFDPVFDPELGRLVKKIQNFYKQKEKMLRAQLGDQRT